MCKENINNGKKLVKIKKNEETKFPCNRPSHKKGKIPTKAELEYRRLREGD